MRIRRPRHGTVAAYAGLFIALGGTSYAAVTLPRNSVGNAQLKRNAVTGAKVRNGSLTRADFRARSLPAGARGPQGPAGPAGATGPAGPSGANIAGVVNSFGSLVYGRGVTAVTVSGSGVYTVSFSQNVSRCPAVATIGGFNLGGNTQSTQNGTVTLQPQGDANDTASHQIQFVTRDGSGVNTPLPFHFVVAC